MAKVEQAPSKPDSRFRLAFVISTIAVILIVAGYISWQRFRMRRAKIGKNHAGRAALPKFSRATQQ